jgi:ribA/ribD-fused uncharacterized protein
MEGLNLEKEPKKFIYRDNFQDGKVVFECTAKDILEADERYKIETGQDVSRQTNIGCVVEKIEKIESFSGENRFLSNFWPVQVEFDGEIYPSTEQAYKAAKTLDKDARAKIRGFLPNRKELEKEIMEVLDSVTIRPDWSDSMRLEVMEKLLVQKFDGRDSELQRKLIDTGNAELIEGNHWGDTFFGVCDGVGENHLGKILMKVRDSL